MLRLRLPRNASHEGGRSSTDLAPDRLHGERLVARLNQRSSDFSNRGVRTYQIERADMYGTYGAASQNQRHDGDAETLGVARCMNHRLSADLSARLQELAAPRHMPFMQSERECVAGDTR
jgi:hypothetical protein